MDIKELNLLELKTHLNQRNISAVDVVESYLKQINLWNPKINALVSLNEKALDEAKKCDLLLKEKKQKGKLTGIPVLFKDMFCTKGFKTTAASKMLKDFKPPYSATVVQRIIDQGGINLGKTNQDEFAMGSENKYSYWGSCQNPWNLNHTPGGSSGGSAAAVASKMAPIAMGTDTGGSVRLPAHFCGVVGVKPTYGRVSRYGMIAFASSLDQAGIFSQTVSDAAYILELISGFDSKDSTSSEKAVPTWSENLNPNLNGLTIGRPKEYSQLNLNSETEEALNLAYQVVIDAGAKVVDVSLPYCDFAIPTYYLIATSEASSNLARYDGIRFGHRSLEKPMENLKSFYSKNRGEGFGEEVKRRILIGTYVLSAGYYDEYYNKACKIRRLIHTSFLNIFKQCDVLLTPVCEKAAHLKTQIEKDSPLNLYFKDSFTVPINLAGLPAMSVPVKLSRQGLPIGVQIISSHFEEQKMFNFALAIEKQLKILEKPLPLKN